MKITKTTKDDTIVIDVNTVNEVYEVLEELEKAKRRESIYKEGDYVIITDTDKLKEMGFTDEELRRICRRKI